VKKKKFLTSKIGTPYQAPGFLLWRTYNQWHRSQSAALAKLGLTHVQFVLLASACWLEKQGELVTQILLANHASTDPMMTSQVVRTLEKRNYITRIVNKHDQREIVVSVTQAGKKLLKNALIEVENVDETFFQKLQSGQEKFVNFLKILIEL
jgi:MarR family transcriptional regulator, organic hydroperoxide resistance regulator